MEYNPPSSKNNHYPKPPSSPSSNNKYENNVIHFYDFEFISGPRKAIYPIEIGISSYKLNENQEINSYHKLIFPGSNIRPIDIIMAKKIHGIEENDPRLEKDYELICEEILNYIKLFKTNSIHFFVCKNDSTSDRDKVCLREIFKKGKKKLPSNIKFQTHVEFFEYYLDSKKFYEVKDDKNMFLECIYRQLGSINDEKCFYHQERNKKFHCALKDSKNNAQMLLIEINHFLNNVKKGNFLSKVNFISFFN